MPHILLRAFRLTGFRVFRHSCGMWGNEDHKAPWKVKVRMKFSVVKLW